MITRIKKMIYIHNRVVQFKLTLNYPPLILFNPQLFLNVIDRQIKINFNFKKLEEYFKISNSTPLLKFIIIYKRIKILKTRFIVNIWAKLRNKIKCR